MTTKLIITRQAHGLVDVTDTMSLHLRRVLLATDHMPYAGPNYNALEGPEFADFTPMGSCPTHGLEPYRAESREVNTGAGDVYLAPIFVCGNPDFTDLF